MPTDLLADAGRMAGAFGVVAAGAVPVGLLAAGAARWSGYRPRLRPLRRWAAAEVLLLAAVYALLPSVVVVALGAVLPDTAAAVVGGAGAEAGGASGRFQVVQLKAMAAVAACLGVVAVTLRLTGGERIAPPEFSRLAASLAAAVAAWLVLTPLTLAVYFAALGLTDAGGGTPTEHPLTQISLADDPRVIALFAVVVCGLTPFVEELLCRGVLLGWAIRRRHRAWVLLVVAVLFAAARGGGEGWAAWAPTGFALVLVAAFLAVRPRRTNAAVYGVAALFAAAHSNVWPSPVPLFVLALGLGRLAVRTGGFFAPAVAHGLFNAVSFAYLLRGPG